MNAPPPPTRTLPPRAGLASLLVAPAGVVALLLVMPLAAAAKVSATAAPGDDTAPLRIVVNIPAYRLDVYEGDRVTATFPVTIGRTTDPTPDGHYTLQSIVWNPWWKPPYHLTREERAHDTPPGPRNPMGKVKLNFTEEYYLHGTPKVGQIGEARSHGCVRLRNEDVIAIAEMVHRYAAPISGELLQSLESTRSWRTRSFALQRPVPVELRYDLAEVRDDKLMVYPDLYHQVHEPLANVVARALAQAGYPWQQLDRDALASALDGNGRGVMPVEAVLRTDAPAQDTTTAAAASPQ